jgi:N-acetylglucosaminyl-diphospho-decaprenol L-rhamnosyltransferase
MTEGPVVYCAVPVHNRLNITKRFIERINCQTYPRIELVIVDDGSSDGTTEFLEGLNQSNLVILRGDGELWWGGAMRLAMRHVLSRASTDDVLLMLNDDVTFDRSFVQELVLESNRHSGAIVGALVCDEDRRVAMSTGYRVDYWRMRISALDPHAETCDALPGRGLLIPIAAVNKCGIVNARLFPHYLSDLEYTHRAKEAGWTLRICLRAIVYTSGISSDSKVQSKGLVSRYFARSKNNVVDRIAFFSVRGPLLLRITAAPRFAFWAIFRGVARTLGLQH